MDRNIDCVSKRMRKLRRRLLFSSDLTDEELAEHWAIIANGLGNWIFAHIFVDDDMDQEAIKYFWEVVETGGVDGNNY